MLNSFASCSGGLMIHYIRFYTKPNNQYFCASFEVFEAAATYFYLHIIKKLSELRKQMFVFIGIYLTAADWWPEVSKRVSIPLNVRTLTHCAYL